MSDGGAWDSRPPRTASAWARAWIASAWDAGIAGTARAVARRGNVRRADARERGRERRDSRLGPVAHADLERGEGAAQLAAPTGESRWGAAGWSGETRARASRADERCERRRGCRRGDARRWGCRWGADGGADAAADATADAAATALGKAERSAASGATTTSREKIAFRVNVCGVPPVMRQNQAPWPVCRVWLVGCPGGARCGIRSRDRPDAPAWTHRRT